MIEKEKDVEKEENFYDSIQEEMKTNPSEMTTRMVTHFQQLFDVKAVRGIMPKMNELFLYSSEMNTFMNSPERTVAMDTCFFRWARTAKGKRVSTKTTSVRKPYSCPIKPLSMRRLRISFKGKLSGLSGFSMSKKSMSLRVLSNSCLS